MSDRDERPEADQLRSYLAEVRDHLLHDDRGSILARSIHFELTGETMPERSLNDADDSEDEPWQLAYPEMWARWFAAERDDERAHRTRPDLVEEAADAIADWINGTPCDDPARARWLVNALPGAAPMPVSTESAQLEQRISQTIIPSPLTVADVPHIVLQLLAAVQVEPDDTPDIELVIDAVEDALHSLGAVVCVAEDDDDSGTPAIATSNGAVCLYDLNNEIAGAFRALVRDKPSRARELAVALFAATEAQKADHG